MSGVVHAMPATPKPSHIMSAKPQFTHVISATPRPANVMSAPGPGVADFKRFPGVQEIILVVFSTCFQFKQQKVERTQKSSTKTN